VVGDQVRFGNIVLTVEALQGRRIEWVILELTDSRTPAAVTEGAT
jgi:hypothetical protein